MNKRYELRDMLLKNGTYGIEMESLRVNENGSIAQTKHPFAPGGMISRDFCESQIEIVTPPCQSIDKLYDLLSALRAKVRAELCKAKIPNFCGRSAALLMCKTRMI